MLRHLFFPLVLLAIWLELAAGVGFTKNGPQEESGGPGAEQSTVYTDAGPYGDPNG